jgi:hypothetical protein
MKTLSLSLAILSVYIVLASKVYSVELDDCIYGSCENEFRYYLAQYKSVDADIIIYPKVLNLKSNRKRIISGIRLNEKYDPHDIDGSSLELSIRFCRRCKVIYPDCGFPSQGRYISVFSRVDLIDDIETIDLSYPTKLELKITGELKDGTPFEGGETIWVIK